MTPQGWATTAVCVALSAAVLWLTWRRMPTLSPPRRTVLLGARGAALVALALALANPTGQRRVTTSSPPQAVVLLDRSASMGVRDAPGRVTRFGWATSLLAPGGALTSALTHAEGTTLLFAEEAGRATRPLPQSADGSATDLHGALAAALRARPEGPPDAVVLVTDGATNRGLPPADLVAWAERQRVPVYCLGVGSDRRPPDAWLARVDAPRSVRAGSTAPVSVTLGARGFDRRSARVALRPEGAAGGEKQVVLAGASRPRVDFSLRPGRPGLLRCTVRLAPLAGEWTAANNSRTFFLRVTPGESKLLFVAGRPSRELKFVRRVLDRVPDLRTAYLVRKADGAFWEEGRSARKGVRLPSGQALNAQDAVVLSDLPARALTGAELQRLADYVRQRGGGLGMLGGPDSFGAGGYAGTPLAGALAVALSDSDGYSGLAAKSQVTGDTSTTSPTSDVERQEGFPGWAALPFLAGYNACQGPKPGATVLLRAATGQPLLAVQRYGQGRTLSWLTDSTFRWVFSKDATAGSRTGHALFWTGLVAWLTTPPNRTPVALETDRDVYESGDPVRVLVSVSDSGFQPVSRAEVGVEAQGGGRPSTRTSLAEVPGSPGRYESVLVAGLPGRYALRARATQQGKELGSDSRPVAVDPPRRELADPAQNVRLLQDLARASGGRYIPADQAPDLPELVRLQPRRQVALIEHRWARSLPCLLAFLSLAGLDWLLRRWWGVG